jgi:hypothetical protein
MRNTTEVFDMTGLDGTISFNVGLDHINYKISDHQLTLFFHVKNDPQLKTVATLLIQFRRRIAETYDLLDIFLL